MNRITFEYPGPTPELTRRQLLGRPVAEFHADALRRAGAPAAADAWTVRLGADLLFDVGGLETLAAGLRDCSETATRVRFRLTPDDAALRDYYGLQPGLQADGSVLLPAQAERSGGSGGDAAATVTIGLPATRTRLPFPAGLAAATDASAPHALLLGYGCEFDLLFANQIAWPAELRRRARRSPLAVIRACCRSVPRSFPLRVASAWRDVAASAEIHPTAVIEGSRIGAGARIGAHCTVRFSVVGADTRLHDGAKVEFSTVGRGCWLMHDLVLYRCHVEDEVFLIHGPYQFSCFHSGSAAFATILMDYLPQPGPIRVATPHGRRDYTGRFLGSVYREGARTLGGALLAPGRVIPEHVWLACDPEQIHRRVNESLLARTPLPPRRPDVDSPPGPE